MKNNIFITILFLCCFSFTQSSQGMRIGGGVSLGYRSGIVKWKSFDEFNQSYQGVLGSTLKSSGKFGPGYGFGINADMTAG
ncbi:MAG: hypothetical protein LPK45_04980, partial [Bacteroidota bacterium]|nr:hypothetical protein [Bacteroidota bacterium]MDX5469172.1 hypothetical protein [Bacteroidota bacterium]